MRHSWVLAVLFVIGCHDASQDVQAMSDRACACKDKACADKVVDDFVVWAKANKDARGDADKAAKSFQTLMQCAITQGVSAEDIQAKVTPVLQ